jgi:photosystem II stability/assembly factor-like uncharacterized protein
VHKVVNHPSRPERLFLQNHWGLYRSDDWGESWQDIANGVPSDFGFAMQMHPHDPDTVYIVPIQSDEFRVVPEGKLRVYRTTDAGESWEPVKGLLEHEHRPKWMPGGGGLCLHTIVTDPKNKQRMGIAISTAGFYRTDDGGKSWRPRNNGVRAVFLPNKYPEFGQCVHKVVNHPSRPERLFLQNHWGLYRSDDWGESWQDIANGVPSDFGFAMQMHPHDPDTVYIVPIQSDEFRVVPEGKLRVYRTTDAGESWQPLTGGLPQHQAFENVLRDGLTADSHDPAGIYFGTRGGKLFGSADEGESWQELADALPPICCVKAAVVS